MASVLLALLPLLVLRLYPCFYSSDPTTTTTTNEPFTAVIAVKTSLVLCPACQVFSSSSPSSNASASTHAHRHQ
jgi:hypothetical protein